MNKMWIIIVAIELCTLAIWDIWKRQLPIVLLMLVTITVLIQCFMGSGSVLSSIGGGLVGGAFLLLSKLSKEALGYGDSLLILIIGVQLGFWSLLECLTYTMFFLGIISLIYLVIKRGRRQVTIPFIPILAAGYLLTVSMGV